DRLSLNFLILEKASGARASSFVHAEAGIRDRNVTGVQTCALPIYFFQIEHIELTFDEYKALTNEHMQIVEALEKQDASEAKAVRSEERRVGKECRQTRELDRETKHKRHEEPNVDAAETTVKPGEQS